jgi:hypothetical protein
MSELAKMRGTECWDRPASGIRGQQSASGRLSSSALECSKRPDQKLRKVFDVGAGTSLARAQESSGPKA